MSEKQKSSFLNIYWVHLHYNIIMDGGCVSPLYKNNKTKFFCFLRYELVCNFHGTPSIKYS
jgi:hypothetical protein